MNAQLPMPALHDAPWPPAQFEARLRALDILQFKLDILWSILDAVEKAWPL